MIEAPRSDIDLMPHEAKNVTDILRFRVRCRDEGKTGNVFAGFGKVYPVGRDGEYTGEIHPLEVELYEVLQKFEDRP